MKLHFFCVEVFLFSPLSCLKPEAWFAPLSHQVIEAILYVENRAGDMFFPIASPRLADRAPFFGVTRTAADAWLPPSPALRTAQVDLLAVRSQGSAVAQVPSLVPVATLSVE